MKFKKLEASRSGKKFRIEEDNPEVGVYLYVYENEKCIRDDLQNDIETCKQVAFEEYNVPVDEWVLIES